MILISGSSGFLGLALKEFLNKKKKKFKIIKTKNILNKKEIFFKKITKIHFIFNQYHLSGGIFSD